MPYRLNRLLMIRVCDHPLYGKYPDFCQTHLLVFESKDLFARVGSQVLCEEAPGERYAIEGSSDMR